MFCFLKPLLRWASAVLLARTTESHTLLLPSFELNTIDSATIIGFEMRLVLVPVPNIQGTAYAHMRNISPYLPARLFLNPSRYFIDTRWISE